MTNKNPAGAGFVLEPMLDASVSHDAVCGMPRPADMVDRYLVLSVGPDLVGSLTASEKLPSMLS